MDKGNTNLVENGKELKNTLYITKVILDEHIEMNGLSIVRRLTSQQLATISGAST